MLEDVEDEGRDEHLTIGPAKARTGCAVCRHAQDNASSASKRVCGFFLCTAAIRRMSVTLFAHRVQHAQASAQTCLPRGTSQIGPLGVWRRTINHLEIFVVHRGTVACQTLASVRSFRDQASEPKGGGRRYEQLTSTSAGRCRRSRRSRRARSDTTSLCQDLRACCLA